MIELKKETFPTAVVELGKLIHDQAKEKGWWPEDGAKSRNPGTVLFLMVTEMAEAYEEARKPDLDVKTIYFGAPASPDSDVRKPEGVPIEIADVIIRAFDYIMALSEIAGGEEVVKTAALDAAEDWGIPEHLELGDVFLQLTRPLITARDFLAEERSPRNCRRAIRGILSVVVSLLAVGERAKMELSKAVDLKHQFNATRPFRHGGKKS